MFNWSELHLFEVTSYKIHILTALEDVLVSTEIRFDSVYNFHVDSIEGRSESRHRLPERKHLQKRSRISGNEYRVPPRTSRFL